MGPSAWELGQEMQATDTADRTEQGILAEESAIGVPAGLVKRRGFGGCRAGQELTGGGQAVDLEAVGEQAVVAHADEVLRDHVEQEATREVGSRKGLSLPAPGLPAVLIAEGDLPIMVSEQALVGESDAVGVAAEVAQDLLRAGHGRLGVDDEVLRSGAA